MPTKLQNGKKQYYDNIVSHTLTTSIARLH